MLGYQFFECGYRSLQTRAVNFCSSDVSIELGELRRLTTSLRDAQVFLVGDKLFARARKIGAQLDVIKIQDTLAFFYELAFGGMNICDVTLHPTSA